MSRPRKCPHCGHILPAQSGYTFDQELNIRCGKCGKVVFPATPAAETELQKPPDQAVSGSWFEPYADGRS